MYDLGHRVRVRTAIRSVLFAFVALLLAAGCTSPKQPNTAQPSAASTDQPSQNPSTIADIPEPMTFRKATKALWQWAGQLSAGPPAQASYLSRGYLVVNGRRVVFLAPAEERGGNLEAAAGGRWFVTMTGDRIVAVDRAGSILQEFPTFPRSAPNFGHDLIVSPDGRLMVKDQRLIRTRDAKVIGRTPHDLFSTETWTNEGLVYRRQNGDHNFRAWMPGRRPVKVPGIEYFPTGFGVRIDGRGCFTWYKLTHSGARALAERCDEAMTPKAVPDYGSPLKQPYLSHAGYIVDGDEARPLAIPQRAFYGVGGYTTALWESSDDVLISIPAPEESDPDDGWGARIALVRCPADGRDCERVPGVIRTADASELFEMIRTPSR